MTVVDYLQRSAAMYPDKLAFIDEEHSITYQELYEKTCRLATGFAQRLNTVCEPVAVIIDRNIESICAFLGIAKSRNFYVPIDVTQPKHRILTIFDQMAPKAVVSISGNLSEELRNEISIPVLAYEELVQTEPDDSLLHYLEESSLDTDPLYAICTSGSTGVPKGVLISHRSVRDFIPVFVETFGFSSEEIFGNQAPFDFDVSVKDIYSTIYLGATTYIIPRVCFSMPKKLMDVLDDQKITTIIWAVSALCIAPEATYVNLYGPTEITCNCLYYVIDREFGITEKLPLGAPFKNEEVLYLNDQNKPVQTGEIGEICVLGTCLALGYYRNPEKTTQAFVQNPLNDKYPELMYRTGDLAELREDGQYYFAARKDFQIKHMGHRIELEEIETFMNAVDGVTRASCLFDEIKNKIVACYTGSVDRKKIVECLREDLPKYMIPNIFLQMDELPINKNGKIDRQKLRGMYEETGSVSGGQ